MSVSVQVYIEGQLCYWMKVNLPDHSGSWQRKVDIRKLQMDWLKKYLQENIIPMFDKPYVECFIVFQSKMNHDAEKEVHS